MFASREEIKALIKEAVTEVLSDVGLSHGKYRPTVMTVEQAAEALALPVGTVYQHLNTAVRRGTKQGRRWFVSREQDSAGNISLLAQKAIPREQRIPAPRA